MKKNKKFAVLSVLAAGTLFQFGCLGGFFNALVQNIPGTLLAEFLLDNDAVFDLFEDGGTTAQ